MRRRLDTELVRRGLAESRELAQTAIADGRVRVRGSVADKAARQVDDSDPVIITGPGPRFVSRGGEKLDAALIRFVINVDNRIALDAGASTGGFTDCLIQRGAQRVICVDVGHAQLHERMQSHPQVENHERVNVRTLRPVDLNNRYFDLIVGDLSFISLRAVAPALAGMAAPVADLVLLVKPQFEATRAEVGKGRGVVRDTAVWRRALDGVAMAFDQVGATMMGAMASPLTGADGNVEFLVHLRMGEGGSQPASVETLVAMALTEVPVP